MLKETGHRAHFCGGFLDCDFRGVRAERFREGEGAEGVEPRIRDRRHVFRFLVDEERVAVENRADPGGVQPFDDAFPRRPAVRPFVAIQFHVAEAEEPAAAMIVDLGESEAARHLDPIVHIGFGEGAEVEKIRAVVERDLVRPRAGHFANGKLARPTQGFLERGKHPAHRRAHDGDPGTEDAELLFARSAEFALQCGQRVHASEEIERVRAGAEGFIRLSFQRERKIEERQRIDLSAVHRLDRESDAGWEGFRFNRCGDTGRSEAQRKNAIGQPCRRCGVFPALLQNKRTGRSRGRAEVIVAGGAIDQGHVRPVG